MKVDPIWTSSTQTRATSICCTERGCRSESSAPHGGPVEYAKLRCPEKSCLVILLSFAYCSPSQRPCAEHPPKGLPDSSDPIRRDGLEVQVLANHT
jgi:hypothetical protein